MCMRLCGCILLWIYHIGLNFPQTSDIVVCSLTHYRGEIRNFPHTDTLWWSVWGKMWDVGKLKEIFNVLVRRQEENLGGEILSQPITYHLISCWNFHDHIVLHYYSNILNDHKTESMITITSTNIRSSGFLELVYEKVSLPSGLLIAVVLNILQFFRCWLGAGGIFVHLEVVIVRSQLISM